MMTSSEISTFYTRQYPSYEDMLIHEFQSLIENSYKLKHDPKFYANKLFISYRQLSRITERLLGISPNEYLHDRLLNESKLLLAYTRLSIKEITYELGFNDPTHFSRFFKKRTFFTPSYYREIYNVIHEERIRNLSSTRG